MCSSCVVSLMILTRSLTGNLVMPQIWLECLLSLICYHWFDCHLAICYYLLIHCTAFQFKDVRAHCYCASLVRTLFIGHARATSFSSARTDSKTQLTKHRADDLCVNLVREYFCWMLGDPHFFFGRSLPFLTLFIILKNKKNLRVGSFNYFSYTIKKRVELVHGYRCVSLKSRIF